MNGWILRLGIIAAVVIGGLIFRDRLSSSAGDLALGDCFDVPSASTNIKDVQHHPCTESHTGEVFAIVTHSATKGTPSLTEAQLFTYLSSACGPLFTSYVGEEAASQQILDFGAFYPRADDWNDGDRRFTCYAYRVDDKPMTSSVKKTP